MRSSASSVPQKLIPVAGTEIPYGYGPGRWSMSALVIVT